MGLIHYCMVILLMFCVTSLPASDIAGKWEGSIDIMNRQLAIKVSIDKVENSYRGAIDIPLQNAYGLPLTDIINDNDSLSFDLVIGPGNVAAFKGKQMGDSVYGLFSQKGYEGTFSLKKSVEKVIQLPYLAEEVSFINGDAKLAGTLTIPDRKGEYPAVVLISGSGSQNRDEEVFGFKVFRKIADFLTRKGIAVLRFDDRGVGSSTGDAANATSVDFAGDVRSAIEYLKEDKNIAPDKIGMLGHSEGGIIAPMVENEIGSAFIISMAGTSVNGEKIILAQQEAILKSMGKKQEEINIARSMQERLFAAIKSGEGIDRIRDELVLYELKDYEKNTGVPADPEYQKQIEVKYDTQIKLMQSPWYMFFLKHDPSDNLSKVKCPFLALYGGLDTQVPIDVNRPALERAMKDAGNNKLEIKTFPKANHLFQEAETGSPMEYQTLEKEFVPGFLEYIVRWIEKTVGD